MQASQEFKTIEEDASAIRAEQETIDLSANFFQSCIADVVTLAFFGQPFGDRDWESNLIFKACTRGPGNHQQWMTDSTEVCGHQHHFTRCLCIDECNHAWEQFRARVEGERWEFGHRSVFVDVTVGNPRIQTLPLSTLSLSAMPPSFGFEIFAPREDFAIFQMQNGQWMQTLN